MKLKEVEKGKRWQGTDKDKAYTARCGEIPVKGDRTKTKIIYHVYHDGKYIAQVDDFKDVTKAMLAHKVMLKGPSK